MAADPKKQAQGADPKTQGLFDRTVKQGMQAVTSPQMSQRIAQDAQARGPAAAIAEAVVQALSGVKRAAEQSGVPIGPEIMQAAAVAIAQVLIAMMVDTGMAKDPDALLREVVTMLKGADQPPQAPAAQAAPPGMLNQPRAA